MKSVLLPTAVLLCVVGTYPGEARAQGRVPEDWQVQMKQGWLSLRQDERRSRKGTVKIQGTTTRDERKVKPRNDDPNTLETYQIAVAGRNRSFESDKEVTVFNDVYAFRLKRDHASAPWRLTKVVISGDDANYERCVFLMNYARLTTAPLTSLATEWSFLELWETGGLSLIKAEKQSDGLIRVEYLATVPHPARLALKDPNYSAEFKRQIEQVAAQQLKFTGHFLLDPTRKWIVREMAMHSELNRLKATLDSHVTPDGCVVCDSWQVKGETDQLSSTLLVTFDTPAQDVPVDSFRLSHYGFPEPMGVVWEKATPRYVWYLIAAAVLIVLAAAFRYLGARRSSPARS